MLTAAETKCLLQANHLRLTKKRGQNYLIDPGAIARIVHACGLNGDVSVVEIGAGLGALTESLAKEARRVLAVEVDAGICPLLKQRAAQWPGVSVACQDILTLQDEALTNAVVVGAIPYAITSPILVWLTERRRHLRYAVLVTQKEVAQRLVARPGTKAYGRLTLLAQYGWEIKALFTIARSAFFPQPSVDSTCLQFLPRRNSLLPPEREALFFAIVKAAFSQRRKQLVNNLQRIEHAPAVSRERIGRLLKELGFAPDVRGEMLSLYQFIALTNAFHENE